MWSLTDYETAFELKGGRTTLSTKRINEYDCSERKVRTLLSIDYEGHMEQGDAVTTDTNVKAWDDVTPDSVMEDNWDAACGKH